MGTTTNYAWPYPANSDGPFGPSQIQAIGAAADTTVKGIDDRVAAKYLQLSRATDQTLTTGTGTDISWTVEDSDTSGIVTVPVTTITIPTAGVWSFTALVPFATNATGYRGGQIFHITSGKLIADFHIASSGGSNITADSISGQWKCAAADTVKVVAIQTSGGNLNLDSTYLRFSMARLPS